MPGRSKDQGERQDSAQSDERTFRSSASTRERSSSTRRAVLQSVYEDNLGLPRSFAGKRTVLAIPASSRLGRAARSAGKLAFVGLCTAIAWLGVDLGILNPGHASPEGPRAHVGPTPLLPSGANAVAAPPTHHAVTPDVLLAATSMDRYAAMLSELDIGVADLFDLKVKTIVIDPGHGGRDPGATGHGQLKEKDVVLDIARRLRNKLVAGGIHRVLLTREDDSMIHLKDRVQFATRAQADLFISVHINSVPPEAGPVNYVETYYFGPHTDQRTLDLAQQENRGSDYPIGDFRKIIARIGDTLKTEESARLAGAIHTQLYDRLRRHSDGLMDAGVKSGPFVVLLGVEVPSVLVEIACISNEAEAKRLSTPHYRDRVAAYLQAGVVEYLRQRAAHPNPSETRTPYVAQEG